MTKLLIIADDFTGALDTGVNFAKLGINTLVVTDARYDFAGSREQVIALDTETRHLSQEAAGAIVGDAVKRAAKSGVQFIYKKTDSALRGNIGSELSAALLASKEAEMYFVPAFPKANRVTAGGIHYIDGVPVAESVFGRDPFEPVTSSSVLEIIGRHEDTQVCLASSGSIPERGGGKPAIIAFDAKTNTDLFEIATLAREKQIKIFAGCAGFAEFLPKILDMESGKRGARIKSDGLVVISGSVNPISVRQIRLAEESGFARFPLTLEQKINPEYAKTKACDEFLDEIAAACSRTRRVVIDSSDGYIKPSGSAEESGQLVAENIARLTAKMLEREICDTYMFIGGDTLISVMRSLGCEKLKPVSELSPGVVLSIMPVRGKKLNIISKSGGLGGENVLIEIEKMFAGEGEENVDGK